MSNSEATIAMQPRMATPPGNRWCLAFFAILLALSTTLAASTNDAATAQSPSHPDTEETAALNLLGLPVLLQQPQDVFAVAFSPDTPIAKSTATFAVLAVGDLIRYQWYRRPNGKAAELIPGATEATLSLARVSAEDAGMYWVEVSTLLGSLASATAELSVLDIVTQPISTVTELGQNIVLSVTAQGPDLQYQWTRNGIFVPGANRASLTISNAQPQDGGTYSALVFNSLGEQRSDDAVVRVNSPMLPFSDNFEDRGWFTGMAGTGWVNNLAATRQTDDPDLKSVRYNDSMWVSWTAPTSGFVTMSTLGSDFDTLLAVYTGSSLTDVQLVAVDDESGGYHNSRVMFNVTAGTTYHVRIDSYLNDIGGNCIFSWSLVPANCRLPFDITPPGNVTAKPGDPVDLCVGFNADQVPCGITLQWFRDGAPLISETNACFSIPALTFEAVGTYHVVLSADGWKFEVEPSEVQLNTEGAGAQAQNRLNDARRSPLQGVLSREADSSGAPKRVKSPTPLASGYSGSQAFRTYSGKDPNEPNACGVLGGASYWFSYSPPESGTLRISTDGSAFDTVLGIYIDNGSNLGYQSLVEIACDNNSGSNGLTSTVSFPVTNGTTYYIMVDGVNGAHGRVILTYSLDTLPKISTIPNQVIQENTSTTWIPFTVRDTETAPNLLVLAGTCANTNLVAQAGITFSGSGTNRTVHITPRTNTFGTNSIVISVTDAIGGIRSTQFILSVVHVAQPLEISGTLPHGMSGTPYSAQVTVNGGAPPYSCSLVGSLPAGLTFSSSGVLSGTPQSSCTNTLQISVVDALGSVTNKTFSLVVLSAVRIVTGSSGGGLNFEISGRPNHPYILERAEQLPTLTWTPVATNSSPTGNITFPPQPPSGAASFFRVREE